MTTKGVTTKGVRWRWRGSIIKLCRGIFLTLSLTFSDRQFHGQYDRHNHCRQDRYGYRSHCCEVYGMENRKGVDYRDALIGIATPLSGNACVLKSK